ncbi:lysozyme [Fuscovulum blasticum]|uniref:lysozyme n=1 Tax=Fuscovulum blasticum TaxID=1075 RepID=UPI000D3E97D3|nr:lysozyme [Fuscovulum blasticum]AWD21599.1 hypothetical protein B6K69_07860 [Fuscovulum blasticum]
MNTSDEGKAALEAEEGVVLRAYRCPSGEWTIGPGLTAASGVIKPRAGMVITRAQARELMAAALRLNYEPRVARAMTRLNGSAARLPAQHEFDAGVLFDWNTGAIAQASWVKRWKEGAKAAVVRAALGLWNKGGGRVLPGLIARRQREADILLLAKYPVRAAEAPSLGWATWGLTLTAAEKAAARAALARLGYAVGGIQGQILLPAVTTFQADHDLTQDGIIGRATLSTLQRRIDAVSKATPPAAAAPAATYVTTTGAADHTLPGWVDTGVLAVLLIWLAVLAYRYRDVVAAKIASALPRVAAVLRSF